jgi:iron complex outermembrane recepter protein
LPPFAEGEERYPNNLSPRCLAALLAASFLFSQKPNDVLVVTGTPAPVPLEEADRAVRRFDVDSQRLLINTFADLLRLDASVDLRARAPHAVQTDLSIRGSTFGQTLVLFDGLRINDAQSGHHNLNLPFPLESLGAVEVLRGTGSTLYGADAVGGVVQFLPRRPESPELRLRAALGNYGANQQRASAAWARPRFTQQMAASRDFSTGFTQNRDYRNLSLASSTWWQSKLGASSLLLAHNDRPFGAQNFYGNFNSWERTKAWFAGGHQALGEKTQAGFAYRRHTDLFVLYRDRPQVFTNRHASESWQGTLRRREHLAPGMTLHFGAEGYGDQIVSNNLGRHQRARAAAYASYDARVLKRASLNVGVRDELWGSFNHQWTPSVAGGFWLTPRLKLRASVSRAFRVPTYTDLYYQDPANRGTPDLRPERAWGSEAGLEFMPADSVRASLTVFRRDERDGIDYVRSDNNSLWRAANIQRLRFNGVEASARWRWARQEFDLHYTGLRGTQQSLSGLLSKYVFNYPVHAGVAGWQGQWRGWAGRARLGAMERLGRSPYALLDLYATRAEGAWRPFFQVTNLNGALYQEIPGVAMPGRGVMGGVEWVLR